MSPVGGSAARVRSVREATAEIKAVLEGEFPFLWVRGQVTNLSRPGSGHLYFTLKDEEAALSVVWFKGSQRTGAPGVPDPLTGEVSDGPAGASLAAALTDGQEVLVAGRINVYPPRGQYQLVAEVVQDVGLGRLYVEFERLKNELAARGFFAAERKRELPYHSARVAVITAPTGAAVRDFVRIAAERGWGASMRIYPALMQGDAAGPQIAAAIERANADGWAECIALMRGGGSLEDLWAFNTVEVAEAVYASGLPVIAGVGHEVDHTIADMTADVRAATPSHAAQILWPERERLAQQVDGLETALVDAFEDVVLGIERELADLEKGLSWFSPVRALDRLSERLAESERALGKAFTHLFERKQSAVVGAGAALSRFYGPDWFEARDGAVGALASRVLRAGHSLTADKDAALERCELRLAGLNPEAPLERGYSLVRSRRTGKFLRSVQDAQNGDGLDIRVADGEIPAVVLGADAGGGKPKKRKRKTDQGPQQGSLL